VNLRVLFVEDSPDDVEFMLRRLREAGIEAQWQRVESAAALREALAAEPWQVALVDFNLPSFSGPQAIALLAELAPDTPAITVSGAISEETAVATITAGAVDYVLKDNLTRLAPAALRAVEGAELRRKERRAAAQARQTMYAVEHSSQAILYVSQDGTVLYANAAAARLGGVPSDEAVGAPLRRWVPTLDEPRWAELWRAALQQPIVDFEATVCLPGGEERLVSATLDHHEHDADAFVIVYARDVTARKQAEGALAHSHDLMRYIIAHAQSAVAVHDRDLKYIYVSRRYLQDYGVKERDVIGKGHYDVFPDLPQKWRDVHQKALAGEISSADDDPYVREDGSVDWTRWECRPWYEADGSIGGIIVYTEVITARKQIEEALRESEAGLAEAQRIAHVGSWDWDIVANKTTWSDEMYRLFGLSPEAFDGSMEAVLSVVHPDDRERCVKNMEDNLACRTTPPLEYRVILPDGVERTVYSTSVTECDEAGAPVRNTGTVQDITERRHAEEALRESEERFEQFAEHFPGYLFMHDELRRYIYVNRHEEKDGTVPRGEWLGKTPLQVWGAAAAQAEVRIQRALDGELIDFEEPWTPPGMHECLHTVYFPIPRDGKPPLVGGLSIDVTAQVAAEAEVRRQAEQLRRTVEGAVLALGLVVETRDPYTAGHERRVSELATAIAAETGMAGEALEALRLAALIHDIGKIAVPAEILSKPGRLSEVEFNLIKQHPGAGFEILAAIDFGLPVAEMVLQHHERLDGSGYPQGLAGEDVLPEARILAVADVVEAMSSHRPYRAALGMEAALAEVRAHAGEKYDADVVASCVRLVEEQGFAFTP
jgi:PAS domain S-box-containing protein/putative nucleotidyltransferase with HDIG domain